MTTYSSRKSRMNQLMTTYLKMLKITALNSKSLIKLMIQTIINNLKIPAIKNNNNKMIHIMNQKRRKLSLRLMMLLLRLRKLLKTCMKSLPMVTVTRIMMNWMAMLCNTTQLISNSFKNKLRKSKATSMLVTHHQFMPRFQLKTRIKQFRLLRSSLNLC